MQNIDSFATAPMWAGFIAFVLAMLALDLFVLGGRQAHRVSVKEASAWVVAWVTLALAFGALLWWYLDGSLGREVANRKALEFVTGYLIEQSLSVDNMFVFVMIFTYFAVPPELQRRVLLYGVLGAIVMRAGMILAGVWLVQEFAWVLYVFGAFLVLTGIKMLVFADRQPDLDRNPLLRWLRGHMRITPDFHGQSFFVHQPDAGQDHAGAHDDGPQHAVQKHAPLLFERHGEVAEEHHEDEHVIHRQRLLNQVAGDELERLAVRHLAAEAAVQVAPHQCGEGHCQHHPGDHPGRGLLDGHPVHLLAAEHEQVERQHGQHEHDEAGPHRGGGEMLDGLHVVSSGRVAARERLDALLDRRVA